MKHKSASQSKPEPAKPNPNLPSTILDDYESLQDWQKDIIEMRLDGYRFRYITQWLAKSGRPLATATLTWMFANVKGRKHSQFYRAYIQRKKARAAETTEMVSEARQKMKDLLADAIVVIQGALQRKDVDSAWKVLEYNGLKPATKLEDVTEDSKGMQMLKNIINAERLKLHPGVNTPTKGGENGDYSGPK
jgi:hypothetical protein